MEAQCSPLSWEYYHQEEGMKELRQALLYTTLELETTIVSAKEEIRSREYELVNLNDVLSRIIRERDEAQEKCLKLLLEKALLQQQLQEKHQQQPQQHQQQQEAPAAAAALTSSLSSDSTTISSPGTDPISGPTTPPSTPPEASKLGSKKPLPQKGKLLQAVMEAGPLLQTLLLAGPLPQWQHPPPQLDPIEIPPVAISSPTPRLQHQDSCISTSLNVCPKKRGLVLCEGSDFSHNKSQKVNDLH